MGCTSSTSRDRRRCGLARAKSKIADIPGAVVEMEIDTVGGAVDPQEFVEVPCTLEFISADDRIDRRRPLAVTESRRDWVAALEFLHEGACHLHSATDAH